MHGLAMTITICDLVNNRMYSASTLISMRLANTLVLDRLSSFGASKEVAKSALFFNNDKKISLGRCCAFDQALF